MKINLDKSAFPTHGYEHPNNTGLTVREELWVRFAAAALQSAILIGHSEPENYAYWTANDMITAIEKQS